MVRVLSNVDGQHHRMQEAHIINSKNKKAANCAVNLEFVSYYYVRKNNGLTSKNPGVSTQFCSVLEQHVGQVPAAFWI